MPITPPSLVPGDFIYMDITADGFLYNMVRSIMGTLIHVGRGSWDGDRIRQVLETQDRSCAGNTAPACGLYLVWVEYPRELLVPGPVPAGTGQPAMDSHEWPNIE